ncbi:MAG: FAD-binding oxidoreductase [Fimbriimonadaceae bacterium]|nr:FAD-binding oxidoreductase [Chitinophagales bacterium]
MDLVSGQPYWLLKNGFLHAYQPLRKNYAADVVIIGGGITGAIVAHSLTESGIKCCIIDKGHIAMGSTSASTSLIQYEIDRHLSELIRLNGEQNAATAYKLCADAVEELLYLANIIGDTSAKKKQSLYFTSSKKDIKSLQREFEIRKKHKFDVKWLDKKNLEQKFNLFSEAAILSDNAAIVDAYSFTHNLLNYNIKRGLDVFSLTESTKITYKKNGVIIKTKEGFNIATGKVIYATGYESQNVIRKKIVNLNSTYAFASLPITDIPNYFKTTIFWETARPYLYFRSTSDNRLMIGGMDDKFKNPQLRNLRLNKKVIQIKNKFTLLYPSISIYPDFTWAGTFGETKDGLPYIGEYKGVLHSYFACGFGGNGITFSVIAAQIIKDLIVHKHSPYAKLFSFTR